MVDLIPWMRRLIIISTDALALELDNDWKLAGWYLWAQIETNRSFPDFSSVLDFISKSMCVASTRDYGAAWAFYWTFAPHGSCVSCRHYVWKLQEPSERRHAFTEWIFELLSGWSKMNFESTVHHYQTKEHFWKPIATILSDTLGYSSTCQVSWNELLQHNIYYAIIGLCSNLAQIISNTRFPFHLAKAQKQQELPNRSE